MVTDIFDRYFAYYMYCHFRCWSSFSRVALLFDTWN